ncbi:MAG: hypothetical protein ACREC7_15920 [Methyloceanibacter sp.]
MRCAAALSASLVLLLAFGGQALAQRGPAPAPGESKAKTVAKPKPKVETKQQAPAQPAPPSAPSVVMPDGEKIVLLVRTTLNTLNDAIQTGNYTVLRDRGAPGFREANSAARLSQIFSDFASRNVDLSVVSLISPQLTETPVLDQDKGMLNIKGYFPTQPVQINFELLYQAVEGRWRLFGLSVQPSNAEPSPAPATPTPEAPNPTPEAPSPNSDAPKSQP